MSHNRREIIAGATILTAGLLTPASRADTPTRSLLIVGDWGRDGHHHQRDVARQMDVVARERDCAGVISVGDNFYEDGVKSIDDPKWRISFEEIYSGPSLRPLPWYVALGNHDYGGVPQAQVDYSTHSDRWTMPSRYFKVPGEQTRIPELDLFVIDTNPLIADNASGNGALAVNVRGQDATAQLTWLDQALGQSRARYKIVAGHHTVFSGGSTHGDTPDLIAKLLPILKQHGVSAYLNGHDHDLQHIARDGLHFICAGAGSQVRSVSAVPGTQFCVARSGFAILSVRKGGLWLEFRGAAEGKLYEAALI